MILPSRQAFVAYLAVSMLLFLGPVFPSMFLVVLALDLAITLLVFVEGRTVLSANAVLCARETPARFSVSEENEVTLTLRNIGTAPLLVSVLESPPKSFQLESRAFGPAPVAPEGVFEFSYLAVPTARGRHEYGDLWVRLQRPAGMAVRRVRIPARQDAKVYPNLEELRRYETLRQSRRLVEFGAHSLRKFGKGSEFESLREYVPYDDYKDINWSATARRGSPVTQLYQVERSQNVMIVIDSGRMMSTRTGDLTKFDYAVNAGLMLAYVARRSGDKVGLTLFSDKVKSFVPTGAGQAQIHKIIEELYPAQPDGFFVDYKSLIHFLKLRNKKRGMVVIFTDFPDAESGRALLQQAARLRRSHLVLCVTVSDDNLLRIRDSHPANPAQAYEKTVALECLQEREEVLRSLAQQGVQVLDLPCEKLSLGTLNKYIEIKSRAFL